MKVKDGGALARATSIGPKAATGLEVSADTAGGIPRYGIMPRFFLTERRSMHPHSLTLLHWMLFRIPRCRIAYLMPDREILYLLIPSRDAENSRSDC